MAYQHALEAIEGLAPDRPTMIDHHRPVALEWLWFRLGKSGEPKLPADRLFRAEQLHIRERIDRALAL